MKKLYLMLLLCAVASIANAQSLTRSYHSQSLSAVLEDLSKAVAGQYDIAFVYNDLEDFTVTCSVESLPIDEALRTVVGFIQNSMVAWFSASVIALGMVMPLFEKLRMWLSPSEGV